RRTLADRIDCAEIGSLDVKGFATPVNAYRLLELSPARSGAERRLVGRRAELAQFKVALGACREAGQGQTVVVRGEAGIGKTRLVEEFQAQGAAEGFACHLGLVLDFGAGAGQDAIRALVRRLLGLTMSSNPATVQTAADQVEADGLIAHDRRVYLNDLLDLPQPIAARALYDAMDNPTRNRGKREMVGALVRIISQRQPLLLVVEDVHWADRLTLEHLATLTAAVADCLALGHRR
ncbi:MAG: ATP-binding protein, partial [Geminicoccales bacterium]